MRDKQSQVIERWKPHLEAAAASGMSVKAYAQAHGLSRKTLYAARKRLQQAEAVSAAAVRSKAQQPKRRTEAKRARSRFAAVRVVPPLATPAVVEAVAREVGGVRAVLPNGIVIECTAEGALLGAWLTALMRLPCSGSTRS